MATWVEVERRDRAVAGDEFRDGAHRSCRFPRAALDLGEGDNCHEAPVSRSGKPGFPKAGRPDIPKSGKPVTNREFLEKQETWEARHTRSGTPRRQRLNAYAGGRGPPKLENPVSRNQETRHGYIW